MVEKRRFDNRGMVRLCQFDDSLVCDLIKLKLHFTFVKAVRNRFMSGNGGCKISHNCETLLCEIMV